MVVQEVVDADLPLAIGDGQEAALQASGHGEALAEQLMDHGGRGLGSASHGDQYHRESSEKVMYSIHILNMTGPE
jgi:hypothetical protein